MPVPKLPSAVRVAGQVFRVTQEPTARFPIRHSAEEGMSAVGEIDYHAGTIRIGNVAFPAYKAEILLHECWHAILRDSNLEFDSEEDEEYMVEVLSARFLAFMADNPRVMKWFAAVLDAQPSM